MVSRGFGVLESLIFQIYMFVIIMIGIMTSNEKNVFLFPVVVVYIITAIGDAQWVLRQLINIEGFMVSAERILEFKQL